MSQDLTKSGKEVLVDLINDTNGTAFTAAQLTFGTPSATPNGSAKNTMITVEPAAEAGFTWEDPKTIYYDRLDLAVLFGDATPQIEEDTGAPFTSTLDLIPALNALKDINIVEDDIVDEEVSTEASYPAGVVVKAAADSLVYFGQISTEVINDAPDA